MNRTSLIVLLCLISTLGFLGILAAQTEHPVRYEDQMVQMTGYFYVDGDLEVRVDEQVTLESCLTTTELWEQHFNPQSEPLRKLMVTCRRLP